MDKRDLVQVKWSAVMVLHLTVMNTSTVFFWSSLGLLGCEILGPIEGSTPLRASSSKSMRSTNFSPYVKNLNYVAADAPASNDEYPHQPTRQLLRQTFHEFSGALPNCAQ